MFTEEGTKRVKWTPDAGLGTPATWYKVNNAFSFTLVCPKSEFQISFKIVVALTSICVYVYIGSSFGKHQLNGYQNKSHG